MTVDLNQTSTEMLKSYILSRFANSADREMANRFWKKSIQKLHQEGEKEDLHFFQAWMRSQYADTIRQGSVDSSNEDFEKIGTRFHRWFRDNLEKINLDSDSPDDFRKFGATSIRYTMYTLMKELRGKYLDSLQSYLQMKLEGMDESWNGIFTFRMHS
ncbi:MAG: hypothetical protein PWQ44_2285 [Methanolobus sp.]|jgi:hypothetical protein|nr:hypothetical protein [Methanolobus sp.]